MATITRTSTARTSAAKVASAASVLFAIALFWTVASVDVPHKANDAKLLDWWQQSSNQLSGIVSQYCAIAAALLFVVLINYVRTLTAKTDAVQWSAFARSMGLIFSTTLLVSAALRGVIGHMMKIDGEPLPGLDVLRYSTALNYDLIGSVTMTALGLTILAVSVVVVRTVVLAKWFGYVGLVCSVIILVASAAMIGQYTIILSLIWSLCLSVAIWRRPATS
ncbi:hypothetical protein [Kribbella kalugense]|uniref:DUF4386 family protein n=1 Tax=Kribbella kalugense TaxID=2512221 RepID=A0A4V3G886_9ACTN|nr:hypothetical protein [Kribbella kalugense]TDW21964.1 hypothetical protein EV650_0795 [Kribbella kalugense]